MTEIPVHELHNDYKFLEGYKHICELAVEHYDHEIFKHSREWYQERINGCDEMMDEIGRRLHAKGYRKHEGSLGRSYWARSGPDSKDAA